MADILPSTQEQKAIEKKKKQRRVIFKPAAANSTFVSFQNIRVEDLKDFTDQLEAGFPTNPPTIVFYESSQIRTGPSKAQIKKWGDEYLAEYRARESTIQRKKAKAEDPVEQQKKREYAARPEVKKKKRESARMTRIFRKMTKETRPDIYAQMMEQIKNNMESDSSTDSSEESESDSLEEMEPARKKQKVE
jgi:hypothetical protein